MNESVKNRILSETTDAIITEIARISWNGGEKLLINDNKPLEINGEEYEPCGFSFSPPSDSGKEGEISVDDTDGTLTYTLQEKESISVMISIIDTAYPDYPLDGPVEFEAESFSSTSDGTCSIKLVSRSRLSYGLSKLTYSSRIFPGLFG